MGALIMQLGNQVAMIASGLSGSGKAFARKFAAAGATCAIVASTNIDEGPAADMFISG